VDWNALDNSERHAVPLHFGAERLDSVEWPRLADGDVEE